MNLVVNIIEDVQMRSFFICTLFYGDLCGAVAVLFEGGVLVVVAFVFGFEFPQDALS